MRAKKDHQAGRRFKAHRRKIEGAPAQRSPRAPQDGTCPRPLFVFNVKLFDDGTLPPALSPPAQLPHRYVVVIRRPDAAIRGEGPLRTRLEADDAASRARLALPGSRVHLVVALDDSEDVLDAFFADPERLQMVADEGARARERYEEWRRKAGPSSPSYDPRAARSGANPALALSSPPARRTTATAGARVLSFTRLP
ncbi:MAG: hypothetical protein M3O70_05155 [Actinomycetota bacterium]|nr:hypothetical protein [Actinomycetota bacterium]